MGVGGSRTYISFTFGGRIMNGASHVEHHDEIRHSIVPGLGHLCRFICPRRRWFGRNGTFWIGRSGYSGGGPTKPCYSWRDAKYADRPERDRKCFQSGPDTAAAHSRPDCAAVQVIAKRSCRLTNSIAAVERLTGEWRGKGSFSHEHYSSSHSTTLRAAMGRSVRAANNPGRTKERRIESFAGQQASRPETKEKPARLR
jgi:hypothetical protein